MSSDPVNITLVATETGQSETIPVQLTSTVSELAEWAKALLGLDGDVALFKDGRRLAPTSSLQQVSIVNGDLVAAQVARRPAPPPPASATAPAAGGLDFSSLLSQAAAPAAASPSLSQPPVPVYYPGMSLTDAMQYNPHPHAFISLLFSQEHLLKELNYHNTVLAGKLRGKSLQEAVGIWREEMVKGGIQGAMRATESFHKEQEMSLRLSQNANDAQAKEYFAKQDRKSKVDQQYRQMMQEYPEGLGRVLMLYIETKINGHPIQAFCDSGAQSTIMSKKVAEECGLLDYIDTRFEGMAVGVGTGKILGRIHIVQMQIGDYHFPCSVTVMDDPKQGAKEMPFLLGLDMMKRHTCCIDLEKGVLKFRLGPGQYLEAPFLHEKDLDESQGGTKGFDVQKANQEIMELERKREAEGGDKDDGDAAMSS